MRELSRAARDRGWLHRIARSLAVWDFEHNKLAGVDDETRRRRECFTQVDALDGDVEPARKMES